MASPLVNAKRESNDPARTRLLEAAAACFAAKGYSGTTVRDITSRAGCNVSAVTYHFGGKRKAYEAVFAQRLEDLTRRRVSALHRLGPAPALEDVIGTFASAFLAPLHGSERGRETMTLLLREVKEGSMAGGGSDHAPFAMKGIPWAFLSSGITEDFHQPSDSVSKTSEQLMEGIARLAYVTAFALADR